MALTAATLATELKKIGFAADSQAVVDGWSAAWQIYWEQSAANGVPANPSPAVAVTAFEGVMAGLSAHSTSLVAAGIIKDAAKAFWNAATPLLAYPTAPPPAGPYLTLPPFMLSPGAETAYVAALAAVFDANTAGSKSASVSYDDVAAAVHSNQAGATFLDTTGPTPITYTVA